MKIKSVGELLKEERVSHNVTLEFLAKKTNIKIEYLVHLENNQFDKLPATPFIKGYIKTYAKIFGFEYRPIFAVLRRDYKESDQGHLIPRDYLKPVNRDQIRWNPVTASAMIVGGIFLTLVAFVTYKWYVFNQPPKLEITSPIENQEVAAQVKVAGYTDPEAILSVNSQPVALQPDGSFSTEVLIPREGSNTITIESSDKRGKINLIQKTVRVKF